MKVEKLGEGEPEIAISYLIHGNEPCGYHALQRIKREYSNFNKPVKLVLANEKAFRKGEKCIDEDLNRCLRNPEGETHEQKVAKDLKRELEGLKVLDLHSSYSYPEPFSIMTENDRESRKLATKVDAGKCVDLSQVYSSQMENCTRVAAECGHLGSEKAIRNAYRITVNFLKAEGALEGGFESGEPEVFRATDSVEGSGYQFQAQNFRRVEKGEIYAFKEGEDRRAEEDFYPVLMSTNGYEDMIGFKAEKLDPY
ncbi:MAG: succinylglutamate desuccinylase/aspartoacylase family protein [Candidatus Nanohaloarchaea archaeon]